MKAQFVLAITVASLSVLATAILEPNISYLPPLVKQEITADHAAEEKLIQSENNFVFQYSNEPTHVGVELAHTSLETLYKKLRSFVAKGTFDFDRFESNMDELERQVSAAQTMVDRAEFSETLSSHLSYVKRVFQTMADYSRELTTYVVSEEPGHRLVYKIIELNVRLLALHDSYGRLDSQTKGLAGKLFRFWRNLVVWGDRIKHMAKVSPGICMVFEIHASQADKTLRKLVLQLPEEHLRIGSGV